MFSFISTEETTYIDLAPMNKSHRQINRGG